MADRERLRDELRRAKRELSTNTELRATYGLQPGAQITVEIWDRVQADVIARVEQEATASAELVPEESTEPSESPPPPPSPAPSVATQTDWEARDADARARIFGDPSPPSGDMASDPRGAMASPLFEEGGDARWIGMGSCLLASMGGALLPRKFSPSWWSRQAPITLKFSSARPYGSSDRWHDAQASIC